ncbi:MAG: hypothetical protein AAF702_36950 [Chloroflexota bacterium]
MQTTHRRPIEGFVNQVRTTVEDRLSMVDASYLAGATLIGLILGLCFGLFIGWTLWPVQYVNSYPSDLSVDAKSQYIGAVADAYAASVGDPTAIETAELRLLDILPSDVDEALRYFSTTSADTDPVYQQHLRTDGKIRVNNIYWLVRDLGISLNNPQLPADISGGGALADGSTVVQNNGQTVIVQPNAEQPADVAEASNSDANPASVGFSGSMLGRFMAILIALMILLGGVYILLQLNQQKQWISLPGARSNGPDELDRVRRLGRDNHHTVSVQKRSWQEEEGELSSWEASPNQYDPESVDANTEFVTDGFDDDIEDDIGGIDDMANVRKAPQMERQTDIGPMAFSSSHGPTSVEPARLREPAPSDNIPEARRSFPSTSYSGWTENERNEVDEGRQREWDEPNGYEEDNPFSSNDWSLSPASAAYIDEAEGAMATAARSTHSSPRTRRELLSFTTHYVRGQFTEYEERHQIMMRTDERDQFGRNVGECGIGVNFKNGILQNKPYDLIALDVWLTDKTADVESFTNEKRLLLSEYAIDNDLVSVIQRENQTTKEPLTPQPGLEFEIDAKNLSLACQVLEATYADDGELHGIFDVLRIHMTVYASL